MKVYIVFAKEEYESSEVLAVFDSREEAVKYISQVTPDSIEENEPLVSFYAEVHTVREGA